MVNFKNIQGKWQKKWAEADIFKVKADSKMPKFYNLEMYPYPSGSGLHMGHALNYTIGDIYARFKRMRGFNVLYPMGYDSFGLPAENAAIKAKVHPRKYTNDSIKNFVKQQKALGLSYDWDRMVSSCEPEYYRWNQYFFLKFMEKGLVFRKKSAVNWCPKCNTVLANEQVHDGRCWRHTDTEVEPKELEQWFIKTTEYAEELLNDIPNLQWPERIKIMQENWIGRSEGLTLKFDVIDENRIKIDTIETYTTRADTVYGITYLVLAAEHPKVIEWTKGTAKEKEVNKFISNVKKQGIIERTAEGKEKNGLFLGKYFINPFTGDRCPLWTADYALYDYGTGAVMAVPTHDQRDFEFAKKYKLPLKVVISPPDWELNIDKMSRAYIDDGVLVNSHDFDGMNNNDAIEAISDYAEKNGFGKRTINYKLKDWLVSRQRYWGTPIPVIHCSKCGIVPVPYMDLPVELPSKVEFGKGNPLESNKKFVDVKCPKCGKKAKRETDTMDTFFDSSWYYLRYCDNKNTKEPFDKAKVKYWMPVDQYIGGAEHACMHLIYARFFTKALRDMGYLHFDEPFTKLFNQGMLHGSDGFVMSKSRGNVVLPEEVSSKYGIDTARFFLVSIASPDKDLAWNDAGIEGSARFINKVFNFFDNVKIGKSSSKVESKLNKSIMGITSDIEEFRYNLAIIKLRELFESFEKEVSKDTLEKFLLLLHPFCPHITEELNEKIGNKPFISIYAWPKSDESKIDLKAEAVDSFVSDTINDIKNVLKLTKTEKVDEIILFVSAKWKYELFNSLKEVLKETHNVGEIIKKVMIPEYGKDIAALVPRLVKDESKIPAVILDQEIELSALKKNLDVLKKEFGTDKIAVFKAEEEKGEPKAKSAMPGKAGVLIK